jgi:hypothetical protein
MPDFRFLEDSQVGQELGTDSRLARMIHDAIELVIAVVR